MGRPLTAKQARFVEAYAGNGTEAARLAGYKGSNQVLGKAAHDLLRNPKVKGAIRARESKRTEPLIATREDRQKFWTSVMNDTKRDLFGRLKASELLGKSEADFTEKVDAKVAMSVIVSINGIVPKESA